MGRSFDVSKHFTGGNPVIYVDTVADLQALDTSGLVEGQQASVGEAGMFVWSGSEWLPKNSETITVRIPSDYPTLQEAIDTLSNFKTAQGVIIDLLIESGHEPESGLNAFDGNYSHFRVSSEDAEVSLSDNFTGRFINCSNAAAPVLNCLVDAKGLTDRGYSLLGGYGRVNGGCGVKNVQGEALWVYHAVCHAAGSIWDGAHSGGGTDGYGARISRGALANLGDASFKNCVAGEGGVLYVNRGSIVNAQSTDFSGSQGGRILYSHRASKINAHMLVADGCVIDNPTSAFNGFAVSNRASELDINDGTITNLNGKFIAINQRGTVNAVNMNGTINDVGDGSYNFIVVNDSTLSYIGTSDGFRDGLNITGGNARFGGTVLNAGRNGIDATDAAVVNSSSITIENANNNGVVASYGCTINLRFGSVKGSGSLDISAQNGSFIIANSCETTNGNGGPSGQDTAPGTFNSFGQRGAIFS